MIIGHQKQWEFLKKSMELNRLSHAYLFCGPEKLGKKKVAIEWVSLILGEPVQIRPNPDFIVVQPQGPASARASVGKKEIQISQIRELNWRLSLKPYSASLKIALIDQAHVMNQAAQNCFLKTLEEPKGNTLLILITEYPEILLPTILSRCEIIKFYPVEKKEIEIYLKSQGVSDEKLKEITQNSLGRPGRALDFLSDPQVLENQRKVIKDLIKISNSELASRFQYAKAFSHSPNLSMILNDWLFYFRNILIAKLNPVRAYNGREDNFKQYSLNKLKNIIKLIQNTNFLISTTNVNPRLALEILMLEL